MPDFKPVRKDLQDLARKVTSEEAKREVKMYQTVAEQLERVANAFTPIIQMNQAAIYTTWDDLFRQLERLERYERRARSRRDRAIKEFDYMKTKAMSF